MLRKMQNDSLIDGKIFIPVSSPKAQMKFFVSRTSIHKSQRHFTGALKYYFSFTKEFLKESDEKREQVKKINQLYPASNPPSLKEKNQKRFLAFTPPPRLKWIKFALHDSCYFIH